ncbi:MAG: PEP-CTERM sorting domain-containing protein [Planctomycetota bacterium]|nr:MAG: PEP-CTERM sorting domain-containing protein [Planctomycetota bacterium]
MNSYRRASGGRKPLSVVSVLVQLLRRNRMKRLVLIAAAVALACSAMADVTSIKMTPVHLSPEQAHASQLGVRSPTGYANPESLYDNGLSILGGPSFWPTRATVTGVTSVLVVDDVHMAAAGSITHAHWVGSLPAGANPITFAFFSNPGGADGTIGATIAAFAVTISVGNWGLFSLTVNHPAVAAPKDIWMGIVGTATYTYGPLGGPGVPVGSSHSGVSIPPISGNFHWALGGIPVPEPATISLLVLGGLVSLRRRR